MKSSFSVCVVAGGLSVCVWYVFVCVYVCGMYLYAGVVYECVCVCARVSVY